MTHTLPPASDDAVEKFKRLLNDQQEKYQEVIAKCNRKISVIQGKLKDPARALNKELKEQSQLAKIVMGHEVPARKSNLPKKKTEGEMVGELLNDLRGAGFETSSRYHDDAEEKKEKTGFGFFRG